MKKNGIVIVFSLLILISLILTGCTTISDQNEQNKNSLNIYKVKLTSIKPEDGDFTIKGTTNAPEGAKLFALPKNHTDKNLFQDGNSNWVKVGKNGKFRGIITSFYAIPGQKKNNYNVVVGDKGEVKVFAATSVKDSQENFDVPTKIRTALKKANIKYTVFTADQSLIDQQAKYDDSSSDKSDAETDSSSDSTESAIKDYQSVSYDDFARHANDSDYTDKSIVISGTVLQVVKDYDTTTLLIFMDNNPDETVMVNVDKDNLPSERILEKDNITVKGFACGTKKYTTVLGDTREIPYVDCNENIINNGH